MELEEGNGSSEQISQVSEKEVLLKILLEVLRIQEDIKEIKMQLRSKKSLLDY